MKNIMILKFISEVSPGKTRCVRANSHWDLGECIHCQGLKAVSLTFTNGSCHGEVIMTTATPGETHRLYDIPLSMGEKTTKPTK